MANKKATAKKVVARKNVKPTKSKYQAYLEGIVASRRKRLAAAEKRLAAEVAKFESKLATFNASKTKPSTTAAAE